MLKQLNSLEVKLVDFGFAEPINDKELVSKAGTPGYIPPEIFKLHPYLAVGDVFSLGVIFYSVNFILSEYFSARFWLIVFQRKELLSCT